LGYFRHDRSSLEPARFFHRKIGRSEGENFLARRAFGAQKSQTTRAGGSAHPKFSSLLALPALPIFL
jgi:hypothetical protein